MDNVENAENIRQPESRDARTWAFVAHLLGFLFYLFPLIGNVLGPLIVLLVKGEEHGFVKEHSKEALNFQISMDIYMIVAGLLSLALIGIPIVIGLAIFGAIVMIAAAIAANEGRMYRYPMCIRFID